MNAQSAPRVSVLMTMFNASAYLRPAIESLLTQSFADFELMIVDDGSTDESAAIVESYADPRICFVRNSTNRGQTPCLNQGLEAARGEFVARQDADDLSHPDRLLTQVSFLDAHPQIALLGANARQIDEVGRPLGVTDLPRNTNAIRWANLFDNSFLHSAVMFRRKTIRDEFGGYDETFACSQDYALWSRVARKHEVANLPDSLISLRVRPNSLMRAPNSSLETETDNILRSNLAAEFPERKFSETEIALLSEFRRSLIPGSLPRFRALFDSLRSDFLRVHTESHSSREFARTEALQFARIAYNLLECDRPAALAAYAHALRTWPRLLAELPWLKIIGLALLGRSARQFHRRISDSKKALLGRKEETK